MFNLSLKPQFSLLNHVSLKKKKEVQLLLITAPRFHYAILLIEIQVSRKVHSSLAKSITTIDHQKPQT